MRTWRGFLRVVLVLAYFSRRDHLRVDAIFLRVSSLNCKKGREEKQTIFRSYSFEYSLAQGRRRESQFPLDFAGIWNCRAACSFVKEISRASSKYEISQPVCNSRTMLQLSNNTFLLKERYECFFFFLFYLSFCQRETVERLLSFFATIGEFWIFALGRGDGKILWDLRIFKRRADIHAFWLLEINSSWKLNQSY